MPILELTDEAKLAINRFNSELTKAMLLNRNCDNCKNPTEDYGSFTGRTHSCVQKFSRSKFGWCSSWKDKE